MLPSCQGPGGSSELGGWKVEAHGNFVFPTSRDTAVYRFEAWARYLLVSKKPGDSYEKGSCFLKVGFEVNLTDLNFGHEMSMAFAWNERAPTQICIYCAHKWLNFRDPCPVRKTFEPQEPEALNAPVAEPFPTAIDHERTAERSAASARGVQGGGQGSAGCVSHEAKEQGP